MKFRSKNTTILNYQLLSVLTTDDLEFEILFPEYDDEKLYYKQHISMDIFRDTITRLKDLGLQMIPGTENGQEQLDISIYNNNLRMTVDGVDDIQTFCKTNRLTEENCSIRTYKERYSFPAEYKRELDIKGVRDVRPRFDSELWKFRANLKQEYTYTQLNKQHSLKNITPELENRITKEETSFLNYFKFKKEMKYFRYKKRYSFYSDTRNFRIDLTIVKDSQKRYARTLHESGALDNDAKYEIEIEYIGRKYKLEELYLKNERKMHRNPDMQDMPEANKHINFKKGGIIHTVKRDLIRNMGRILQVIQGSYYVINTEEELFIKTLYEVQYTEVLSRLWLDTKSNIRNVIDILTKTSSRILDTLKRNEEDGIFVDRRNYHITEFYKAIKESVYGEPYNEIVFNTNLEKDALFIKTLHDKMRNALALLDKRYRNGPYVKNKFIGPKPVTMEMFNLDMTHIHSVLYDYTITDKADGVGNLLFVAGTDLIDPSIGDSHNIGSKTKARNNFIQAIKRTLKLDSKGTDDFISMYSDSTRGRVYRIDQNMQISNSGCRLSTRDVQDRSNNTCSILNGEWITKDRTGKTIHAFMVYDCYLHYGELITHYMLTKNAERPTIYDKKTNGSRLLMAEDIIDSINKQNPNALFDLGLKEFKEPNEITRNLAEDVQISELDIFKLSKELWNQYTNGTTTSVGIPYKLDGLIYTPQEKPVGWTPISTNSISSIKFPLYFFQTGVRWDSNMKWKPAEDNSIDFLVHFATDIDPSNGVKSHRIVERSTGRYKEVHLYCGKNNSNKRYSAMPFIPISPYDETAYIAYLPINSNGHILTTQDKIPIEDDTVVEFVYIGLDETKSDYIAEKHMRWHPLRIRHDKTFDYKKAKRQKIKKKQLIRSMIFDNNTIFKILKTYSKNMGVVQDLITKGMRIQNGLENREMVMDVLQNIVYEITKNRDLLEILERNEDYIKKNNRGVFKQNKNRVNDLLYICKNNFPSYVKKNVSTSVKFDLYYKSSPDSIRSVFAEFLMSLQVEDNVNILMNFEEEIQVNSNYGNNFNTAVNNWRNIHFPITEDMIFEGTGIISQEEYYYKTDLSKERNDCPSIKIRKFHNYVKRNLFTESIRLLRKNNPDAQIRLMELACGKGQDLYKWSDNNISLVFGVDVNVDNIENKVNGAQVRYMNLRDKQHGETMANGHKLPDVYFAIGDASRNIRTYDAFHTDSGKEKVYTPIVKDVMEGKYDIQNQKFNLISMQFAIHYMFDKKERLDGLIDNIEQNLTLGGLFIGTCFDGSAVWDKLQNMTRGEFISESADDGSLIWKIKKSYVNRTHEDTKTEGGIADYFPDDEDSLNHPINIYISSINAYIEEYLVNMKYLIKELAKRHIRLLNDTDKNDWLSSDTFEHYHNMYVKTHTGLGEKGQTWSFLNRTFVFRKYNEAKVDIWESIKRRILDESRVRNIMEGNEDGVKTFVLDNYLQDPNLDNKKILSYVLNKLTQERHGLFNSEEDEFKKRKDFEEGLGSDEDVSRDLKKVEKDTESALDGIDALENTNTNNAPDTETVPLLTGTAATQLNPSNADPGELKALEHHKHVKKLRECLVMLHSEEVFGLYIGFLRKKKHKGNEITWEYLTENFPVENAEECLKILKTAAKDVQLYELYHIDLLNIKIFSDLLEDYKRRKNDIDLQAIDPKNKKLFSKENDYHIYIRTNTILQQSVVDYIARISRGKFEFDPLHITIFKEAHTVYSYPEIRSIDETSEELTNSVHGILELLKKDENDDINYNDTVFAKMMQIYGGAKQIISFMQINKKLFKRANKNKKITVYPPIYTELYEYIIKRFIKRYNKDKIGKVMVGGKLATADFTKIFNDVKSIDLFSEVSSNHLDEEAFDFMRKSHKNYLKFKQSGGTMDLKNTLFIKQMDMTTHCETYAKMDHHPVCKQFVSDVNEFKNYLKTRLRK
jgi:hypothetical protein